MTDGTNNDSSDVAVPRRGPIGLTPFQRDGEFQGMLISGRWPDSTLEWTQTLVASVRLACKPGFLRSTTVFGVVEDLPENRDPDTVGMMVVVGNVVGSELMPTDHDLPGTPTALVLLHPPAETRPSLPECADVASGCVLLPGLPELGLEHRAGWAEAEADGTVVTLRNEIDVDLAGDPDTAVLARLLAA